MKYAYAFAKALLWKERGEGNIKLFQYCKLAKNLGLRCLGRSFHRYPFWDTSITATTWLEALPVTCSDTYQIWWPLIIIGVLRQDCECVSNGFSLITLFVANSHLSRPGCSTMTESMDVDEPRGTKRKASELIVTAPRRIQVSTPTWVSMLRGNNDILGAWPRCRK